MSDLMTDLAPALSLAMVAGVEDKSDVVFDRVEVVFKSGARLSVIRGANTYGGDKGLCEVAPVWDGCLYGKLLGWSKDSEGWMSVSDVSRCIKKLGELSLGEIKAILL